MPLSPSHSFRRDLRYAAAAWLGLAILRTAVRLLMIPRPLDAAAVAAARGVLVVLPWVAATPLVLRIAVGISWRRGRRARAVLAHGGAFLAIWLLDATWSWLVLRWTGTTVFVGFPAFVVAQVEQTLFTYAAVVAIGIGARQAGRYQATLLASARLEARLLEARLHVLGLQLQPHFLFNTLNAVSELVYRDAQAARRVLRNLRELLTGALDRGRSQEVPLREELALLGSYVEIQQLRFEGSLEVRVDASPETLDALVPRLVVQPLVENAIRHGTSRRAGAGRVTVRARRADAMLLLEVEDDGPGVVRGWREGLGLTNTRERLGHLYGEDFQLRLDPGVSRGCVVRINVPIRPRAIEVDGPRDDTTPEPAVTSPAASVWSSPLLPLAGACCWLALGLAGAHQDLLLGWLSGERWPYVVLLRERLLDAALWIAFSAVIVVLTRGLVRRDVPAAAQIVSHGAAAALIAMAHQLAFGALASPAGVDVNLAVVRVLTNLCIYAAVAGGTHAWTLRSLADQRAVEAVRLDGELAALRLDALRWQLQPEFLLDTLDAIGQLSARHPARAEALTAHLGDLLRTLLAGVGEETVTLDRELAFLESYVEIERARGLACASLDVRIDPQTARAVVPIRLLQPMAAMTAGREPAALVVRAERRGGELQVEVASAGGPATDAVEQARALALRVERIYGDTAELELVDMWPGTRVILRAPWRVAQPASAATARRGVA